MTDPMVGEVCKDGEDHDHTLAIGIGICNMPMLEGFSNLIPSNISKNNRVGIHTGYLVISSPALEHS